MRADIPSASMIPHRRTPGKGATPMMSDPTAPTPEGVPEADYRDQRLPAAEDDPADVGGELFPPEISLAFDADDGDRLDQARSAPLDEDAHPEHEG